MRGRRLKAAGYYIEKVQIISAAPMPLPTDEEIADVIAGFGRAARDAVARTRFVVEVIKACRAELGEDRPLIYRFSQWKQQDFRAKLAHTPAELEAVLGARADAGVDLFDASVRYFNTPAFAEVNDLTLAGWAKKLTGKLSGAVGGIGMIKGMYDTVSASAEAADNLGLLLKRFEAGEFDLASVGRAILHDPQWVRKVRVGEPLPAFDPASLNRLI